MDYNKLQGFQSDDMMNSLLAAQIMHEKRHNCLVCMEAKLHMVYGICQHRLCASCLYEDSGTLKPDMQRCPVCAKHFVFPQMRPDIPEDNIEIQRYLGIRECPNKNEGCSFQLWDWELDDHLSVCQFEKPCTSFSPRKINSSPQNKTPLTRRQTKECKTGRKTCTKHNDIGIASRRSSRITNRQLDSEPYGRL